MNKDTKAKLKEEIDQLALDSILLNYSVPDDIMAFIQEIDDLARQSKDEQFGNVCKLLVETLEPKKEVDEKCFGLILNAGFEALNKAVDEEADAADKFKNKIDLILKGSTGAGTDVFGFAQHEDLPDFISSARSICDDLERELMALEKDINDKEKFDAVFRLFHTLKGEAGMLWLDKIVILSHLVEHLFEKIKAGEIFFDSDIVTLALEVTDAVRCMTELLAEDVETALQFDITIVEEHIFETLQAKIAAAADIGNPQALLLEKTLDEQKPKEFISQAPKIDFSLGIDLFADFANEARDHLAGVEEALLILETDASDYEGVNKVFRGFHTIKGLASFLNLEDIRTLAHDTETMMDLVRKSTLFLDGKIIDLVLEAVDAMRKLIGILEEQLVHDGHTQSPYPDIAPLVHKVRAVVERVQTGQAAAPEKEKIGQILVKQGVVEEKDLQEALEEQKKADNPLPLGAILAQKKSVAPEQIEKGLAEQYRQGATDATIKIGMHKMDAMVDMIGELVIIGTQVVQNPTITKSGNFRLMNDINLLGKTIREIQNTVMSLRLVPIRPLFQKMQRLIRDLSKKSGKEIECLLSGEETEVDKNIIELLSDPMMHMVRNAVDHGLETTDERVKNGKSPVGAVQLNAYHKGGSIVVEVRDNGRGLDRDRILAKAREKGLVGGAEQIDDQRIYGLIFEAGFSTAEKVTDISGRGVGMDVVRRNIEQLRGKIEIETRPGEGTVFYIRLPLTLASIDGILLEVGNERFVAPIYAIVEFVHPREEDLVDVVGRGQMLSVRGELLRVVKLGGLFGLSASRRNGNGDKTVCIVETDKGRVGVMVDGLLGQQQVVIKSLSENFHEVKGVAGATILGDGSVGLILDFNQIAEIAFA